MILICHHPHQLPLWFDAQYLSPAPQELIRQQENEGSNKQIKLTYSKNHC